MAALVDTNVLVYRYDFRFPDKQETATAVLRRGVAEDSLRLPHQAVMELVAALTRPASDGTILLSRDEALWEAEEVLAEFEVLYPNQAVLRTALRGAALYQLSWYDAHLWAYAEVFGLAEIVSEDFQHGRRYGAVRVVNPFLDPPMQPRADRD
ncbi:MAG: PIN domain-containing protein [Gemmatimonadota bacterium]